MVGVKAYTEFLYCLSNTNWLVLSFVCVYVFVLFPSCVRAYFVIGLWAVEQARK
jgi:hypothetical protein